MRITIDIDDVLKRGDILQTNVGNRRERTCLIVKVHTLKPRVSAFRYRLDAVRWWEIEPEFRRLLFRHAERNGGQRVVLFRRYPARKKKVAFEDYMRRRV
jgi:hypothetical protein